MRAVPLKLALVLPLALGMSGAPGAKDSPVTSAKGPSFVNIGPMAAGPSDVLFIGDSQDVSVYALELGKFAQGATPGTKNVAGLDQQIAMLLSKLRVIQYPFKTVDNGTSVEIWHASHGQFETRSPIYSFVPYTISGVPHLIASYLCTPLVKFPVAALKPAADVRGVTIGEFGTTEPILKRAQNTDHIGVVPEAIPSLKGVEQLDLLDSTHGIILARNAENGSLNLEAIALP